MHFAVTGQTVVFGSELETLVASGVVEPAIDGARLVPLLELLCVPGQATPQARARTDAAGRRIDANISGPL